MNSNLQNNLQHFAGSQQFFMHWTNRMIYTEGVQYLVEEVGGYWLLDIIATEVVQIPDDFMHLQLIVKNNKADLIVNDGNENIYIQKHIEFTDWPVGTWSFYLASNEVDSMTLMLPGEY